MQALANGFVVAILNSGNQTDDQQLIGTDMVRTDRKKAQWTPGANAKRARKITKSGGRRPAEARSQGTLIEIKQWLKRPVIPVCVASGPVPVAFKHQMFGRPLRIAGARKIVVVGLVVHGCPALRF